MNIATCGVQLENKGFQVHQVLTTNFLSCVHILYVCIYIKYVNLQSESVHVEKFFKIQHLQRSQLLVPTLLSSKSFFFAIVKNVKTLNPNIFLISKAY